MHEPEAEWNGSAARLSCTASTPHVVSLSLVLQIMGVIVIGVHLCNG
jgi:hypothetical protein